MKLDIYINWCLSWKHCFGGFHESSGHMGFSGFPFWFGFFSIRFSIKGHAISVSCEFEYFTSNIWCCSDCLKI